MNMRASILHLHVQVPTLRSLTSVWVKIVGADLREVSVYRAWLPSTNAQGIISIEPDVTWVTDRDLGYYSGCGWSA